ncbi:helix-turn-helix domain-containing protein [Micromonospora endolithica]|nr:AraC family transcriptional regulator [Micromonospora endolithica]TWJ23984.1 AraC-like DNA-binding protein [Micromonospora endolithica]
MPEGIGSDPRRRTSPARWRVLGHPDGILVYQARCIVENHGWSAPAAETTYKVVLGRAGVYRRRVNGRTAFADATSVLLLRPGDEMAVSHPLGCGDSYTCLEVDAEVLARRPDARRWFGGTGWAGSSDGALDLAHRMLAADLRRGLDHFEMAERLHRFLGRLLGFVSPDRESPDVDLDRAVGRRAATLAAHRQLADRAREVLAAGDFSIGLEEVARAVGASPHHLSRVFQRVTGTSLTAWRNQLRVRAVLDTLAESDGPPLRVVASEYGFADQAHLTRVVRAQVGHPPAHLRHLLTA